MVYNQQIVRCTIIYTITSKDCTIEELNDLKAEVLNLLLDKKFRRVLKKLKRIIPTNLTLLLASILKSLLFQAYTEINDYNRIKELNICIQIYHSQVLRDSSSYDIDYRDEFGDSRNRDMLHDILCK